SAFIGCRSQAPLPPPPPAEEKMVWASHEKRPEWTIQEPEFREGALCFVGLSDKCALEKDARENAQRDAIKKVVGYIGTDVKDKFERITASAGLSTEVIDQTKAMRNFEEQFSHAMTRKVKPSVWYSEKWERRQGKELHTFYLVYLLAKVPQAEVDRVIAEQEKHQQELVAIGKSAQGRLAQAKTLMLEADNQTASQPVHAYKKYQEAITQSEGVRGTIQGYPELEKIILQIDEVVKSANKKAQVIIDNPAYRFMAAVYSLAKNPEKPITITVANVNYQDKDLSSEFANYLIPELEAMMSQEPTLYKVISQKIFQDELKKYQGSIEDCQMGKFTAITTTVISTLNGLLGVNYWEKPATIEIKLKLLEVGSGRVLGATSVELPKGIFPEGIAYKPANEKIAQQGLEVFTSTSGSAFKVKVWADKGEGAVYKENEIVRFHFRSDKDCYVYLYHMDAEGNVKILFPNRFNDNNKIKANQVYTMPDETMNFDFQITSPFGTEMLKAIASLQPLKNIDIKNIVDFKNIGKIGETNVREVITRSIKEVPKEGYAEGNCVITTIK
ncbi:MAG: DUF4384 domain-containing protein, partial [Planctomycetota bacterium]|nr:DUF4384 domain-containing protein [Planctomycetota bacterium]